MSLLALMAAGSGILGGAGYLMGQQNKKNFDQQQQMLAQRLDNTYGLESPVSQDMLANMQMAREGANFFDWAEGAPNQQMQMTGNYLDQAAWQSQQNQLASIRATAAEDARFWREQALGAEAALQEEWYEQVAPHMQFEQDYYGALDALERGESAGLGTYLFSMAKLLGVGQTTSDEQAAILDVGGIYGDWARMANKFITGAKINEGDIAQFKGQLYDLAQRNIKARDDKRSAMQSREEALRARYEAYLPDLQGPFIFGSSQENYAQPRTAAEDAMAGRGFGGGETLIDQGAALQAELTQAQERIRALEAALQGNGRLVRGAPQGASP